MSFIEFKSFAKQIGLSEKQLIDQFKNISVNINESSNFITEKQKKDLLNYLEKKYSKKEKIIKNERWLTLKRKKITNINVKGKNTIVITKRNHTYVKSDPIMQDDVQNEQKHHNNVDSKKVSAFKQETEKKKKNDSTINSKKQDGKKFKEEIKKDGKKIGIKNEDLNKSYNEDKTKIDHHIKNKKMKNEEIKKNSNSKRVELNSAGIKNKTTLNNKKEYIKSKDNLKENMKDDKNNHASKDGNEISSETTNTNNSAGNKKKDISNFKKNNFKEF